VVVPVTTSAWLMLQRNLLYTAVTRAKSKGQGSVCPDSWRKLVCQDLGSAASYNSRFDPAGREARKDTICE
jgi:UvrD-like helicase C-terminal domain